MTQHRLDDYDFVALARTEKNKRMYQRLMILAHLKNGMSKAKISRVMLTSQSYIYTWLKRFQKEGIKGLQEKPRSGRPRLLASSAHEVLKQKIEYSQMALSGGRIRAEDIAQIIKGSSLLTVGNRV